MMCEAETSHRTGSMHRCEWHPPNSTPKLLRNTRVYPQYFFGVPTKVPTVKEFSRFSGRDAACNLLIQLAPEVGLEPTTLRLTAECSAIELLRNTLCRV